LNEVEIQNRRSLAELDRTARCNPFRTACFDRLKFRDPAFNSAEVLRRWEAAGRRGAIVGLHGHGKTTLLEECLRTLSGAGTPILRLKLSLGERRLPQLFLAAVAHSDSRDAVIAIDGAEQLRWWRWRRFRASIKPTQGCLITSHREGQLPTLVHCQTNAALLMDLVEDLQGILTPRERSRLEQLFARHQGNIRLCLRDLYDQYAAATWPLG